MKPHSLRSVREATWLLFYEAEPAIVKTSRVLSVAEFAQFESNSPPYRPNTPKSDEYECGRRVRQFPIGINRYRQFMKEACFFQHINTRKSTTHDYLGLALQALNRQSSIMEAEKIANMA